MVFPVNNLPTASLPWAREVEKQLSTATVTIASNELNNAARDNQLAASLTRVNKAATDAAAAAAQAQTAATNAQSAIDGLGNLDQSTSTYKINADNLTAGTINASTINITNLNADNITSGSISADRINAGTIDTSNINITSGSYSLKVGSSSDYAYLYVSPGTTNGVTVNAMGFQSTTTAGWWSNFYPYFTNTSYCGLAAYAWEGIRSHTAVVVTSDERTKNSITESNLGLDFINLLNPVSYKYNIGSNKLIYDEDGQITGAEPRPGNRIHYGLIAQEVKQSLDALNIEDFGGWILDDLEDSDSPQALRYEEFISPLIKAVQELSNKVKALENK